MWSLWAATTTGVTGSYSSPGEGTTDVTERKWSSDQETLEALSTPADEESVISTGTQGLQEAVAAVTPSAAASSERGLEETASELVSIATSHINNFTTSASDQDQLLTESDFTLNKRLANSDLSNELPRNPLTLLGKLTKANKNNVSIQHQTVTKLIPDVESNYSTVISQVSGSGLPSGFVASEPQSLIQPRTITDLGLSSSQSGINLDNSSISAEKSRLHSSGFISSSLQYVDTKSPLTEGFIPDMENLTPGPDSRLNGYPGLNRNTDVPYYLATHAWNYTSNITANIGAVFEDDGQSRDISLAEYLWIYVAPIILIVGCIGNILILLVMAKGKFKGEY